jgi:ATP-binding cassette subfamily F protein uup
MEFERLQKEIPELEALKNDLNEKVHAGGLPYSELNKLIEQLTETTQSLERKELRWLELSEMTQ